MAYSLYMLVCLAVCGPDTAKLFKKAPPFATQTECEAARDATGAAIAKDIKDRLPEAIVEVQCVAEQKGI